MKNLISFPSLGLSFNVNRVAFSIFGLDIYWYALIIMTGFLLGLVAVYYSSEKQGIKKDHVFDVAFYGLIFGIICARIYYVIFAPDCLDGNLLNIFNIRDGGIAIYGALIGAVATALVYARIKKIKTLLLFDVCTPGLLIGQCIGRWGNFVNAEVYGGKTDFFLGMSINGAPPVHPLFLYESLWNLAGLILLYSFKKKKTFDGQIFFSYTLWYGIGRLFLEGMRQNEYILWLVPNYLGISQLVSFLLIFVSIFMIIFLKKKKDRN